MRIQAPVNPQTLLYGTIKLSNEAPHILYWSGSVACSTGALVAQWLEWSLAPHIDS